MADEYESGPVKPRDEHPLDDFTELTASEIEALSPYHIMHVEGLYSCIFETKNPEGYQKILGRNDEDFERLKTELKEYVREKNPWYLIPKKWPEVGTGALDPSKFKRGSEEKKGE